MNLESWDASLRTAGFMGIEIVLDDFPHPHNTTSVMISTVTGISLTGSDTAGRDVYLLYSDKVAPPLLTQLSEQCDGCGIAARSSALHSAATTVASGSDVVVFLGNEHLTLDDEQFLAAFQYLAKSIENVVVLTSCSIAKGHNPDGALLPRLLRVLKTANPMTDFLSIDTDGKDFDMPGGLAETDQLIRCILSQLSTMRRTDPNTIKETSSCRALGLVDMCLCSMQRFSCQGVFWSRKFGLVYESNATIDQQGEAHARRF